MTLQVITANALGDGLVVYQAADGSWCSLVQEAEIIETGEDLQVGLDKARAAEADQIVVGIYEIDVTREDGCIYPVRLRERIRAFGPTSHPEFGRGAPPEDFPPTKNPG